jgi:hypothetical protein
MMIGTSCSLAAWAVTGIAGGELAPPWVDDAAPPLCCLANNAAAPAHNARAITSQIVRFTRFGTAVASKDLGHSAKRPALSSKNRAKPDSVPDGTAYLRCCEPSRPVVHHTSDCLPNRRSHQGAATRRASDHGTASSTIGKSETRARSVAITRKSLPRKLGRFERVANSEDRVVILHRSSRAGE